METLEEAHSIFRLADVHTGKVVTDLIEIHFVQLPRIHDIMESGEKDLADWVKVMKGINDPEMQDAIQTIIAQKEVMRMAAEEYMKVTADEILRHQMQSREKYIRDQHSIFVSGQKEAMKKGREEGLEQGLEKGLLLVASKMLKLGKTTEEIIELTGLSKSTIEQL